MPSNDRVTVALPTQKLIDDVAIPEDVAEVILWPMTTPAPRDSIDIVVAPWPGGYEALEFLDGVKTKLVQWPGVGYEKAPAVLPPGVRFANAATVSEVVTAELAITFILAAQRELQFYERKRQEGVWDLFYDRPYPSGLAYKRVLVLGFGTIGKALAQMLAPFEVELTCVATRAREEMGIHVHGIDELSELLPNADIVVGALPSLPSTNNLLDDAALSSLPDGALIVNVGRGNLIDMDALVDHLQRGRLRAALDVMKPEPLTPGHPLWTLPDVILTPHCGGVSEAMPQRWANLVRRQIMHLANGEEPENIVLEG